MGFLRRLIGGGRADHLRESLAALLIGAALGHEDPELESMLPSEVAGRALLRWSLRGENAFTLRQRNLSARERAQISSDLASAGVQLADVSVAYAGRATPSDPPFLVRADRFGNVPASELPLDLAVEGKGMPGWKWGFLTGQLVARGEIYMVPQSDHLRGLPYVVRSGNVQFTIVTDEQSWAEQACRGLPTSGPPVEEDARTRVEETLEQLAEAKEGYAIFVLSRDRGPYTQVAAAPGEPLIGEVVGNAHLLPSDQLTEDAVKRLATAGWTADESGSQNWRREWASWSDPGARRTISGVLLDALAEFSPAPHSLWIELHREGASNA